MRTVIFLFSMSLVAACTLPGMLKGGGSSSSQSNQSSYSRSETTEEVNGEPIEPREPSEEEMTATKPKKKKKKKSKDDYEDFGATCKTNKDCESNTCFVGHGNLGYCTMMCNSWSECPSHWECQRAANAPQKICMQDS